MAKRIFRKSPIGNLKGYAHPPKGMPKGGKVGKTTKKARGIKIKQMKTPKVETD